MAQFLHLNLPAYNENDGVLSALSSDNVCLCCLIQHENLIDLKTCKHNEFIQEYMTMTLSKMLVCHICHVMLKKIYEFKKQVAESSQILYFKQEILYQDINKLQSLKVSKTLVTSFLPTTDQKNNIKDEFITDSNFKEESHNAPEKSTNHSTEKELSANHSTAEELTANHSPFEITTDVEIKHENSSDNDCPLSEIKKTKKKLVSKKTKVACLEEKYDGKIRVVLLTREELLEERERESQKESYLKLPYKCEMCVKGFDHENTLRSHIEKLHEKKGAFKCDICQSVLSSENSFKEHSKRHLRRYECIICGKRTSDIYSVSQHYNQQHKESAEIIQMEFTCEQCDFTTDSHRSYRYHREKHKKQQCNICGNTFVNTTTLKVHMNTVHKQSPNLYKCTACNKSYRSKSGLLNHTMCAHGTAAGAYCALCRTHFTTRNYLINHLNTHSNHVTQMSKKFVCQECNARFVKKSALQAHIDWEHLHTNKHKCSLCSKVFKTAVTLKRHISFVHEKKRPPRDKICDYCGRGFTTLSILTSHTRSHTGARPLQCRSCTATFAHPAALYTHNKLLHNK